MWYSLGIIHILRQILEILDPYLLPVSKFTHRYCVEITLASAIFQFFKPPPSPLVLT